MKKFFAIAALLIGTGAGAQINNTKWKGTLRTDTPMEVYFNFETDSVNVLSVQDNSTLETMKYTLQDSIISFQKLSGMSVCDNSVTCKYKIAIHSDEMSFKLIEDACNDRAQVLTNLKLNRQK